MDAEGAGGAGVVGVVPAVVPLEPSAVPMLAQQSAAAVRREGRPTGARGSERADLDPVETDAGGRLGGGV